MRFSVLLTRDHGDHRKTSANLNACRLGAQPAIAQIPFETVRNWMSKNDTAFRPDFLRAFEKAKAVHYRKQIDNLKELETLGAYRT
jgi:hypothetical protein